MQLAFNPTIEYILSLKYNDSGLIDTIRENPFNLVLMMVMGFLIGCVYEEFVFHGFIFTKLEKIFDSRYGTTISFVITSVLFGSYHIQLGSFGVLNTFIIEMVYLGLFVYFKQYLWYSVLTHGN